MDHLTFQAGHRVALINYAVECLPDEACGLIAGIGEIAHEIFPITNISHNPSLFEMDPKEQLACFKRIEKAHLELVGIYHSHPFGPDSPSELDIKSFAYPGVVYIICSHRKNSWLIGGYWIEAKAVSEIQLNFPAESNLPRRSGL